MKLNRDNLLLYAVTDRRWLLNDTLENQVERAIKSGVSIVQLREKEISKDEFLKIAVNIKKICNKYNVPFIINDDVEIAIKSDADGVHIGQEDMTALKVRKLIGKDKILGVSAQTLEQALKAQEETADYLGVGAVFSTSTKDNASDVSFDTLKSICQNVNIPVVAIGGINEENISKLQGTNISGIAVVSAIFAQKDIENATKRLYKQAYNTIKTGEYK